MLMIVMMMVMQQSVRQIDRQTDRQTGRQSERQRERTMYFGAMCRVIEIILGVRVRHTSWVTSDDVEVCASRQTRLAVPLHLRAQSQVIIIIIIISIIMERCKVDQMGCGCGPFIYAIGITNKLPLGIGYSWWSGLVVSALASSINEVNLRRARLVLRRATVSGFNSR